MSSVDYTIKCLSSAEKIEIEECSSKVARIRIIMIDEEDEDDNSWTETYIDRSAIKNLIERLSDFINKKEDQA